MPDLEERSIETLPARCENCGAALTAQEQQLALETGRTPVLCTTCAAEQEPAAEDLEEADADF